MLEDHPVLTGALADHNGTDFEPIIDLTSFCANAVRDILRHQGLNAGLKEKLERLKVYVRRFRSLDLVARHLRNTHKMHPHWEEDTDSSIFRARNALTKVKSYLIEWEKQLRYGEHELGHGFRDGLRHLFHKTNWMTGAEKELDLILPVLRQQNNHLHKNIQLCAFYILTANDIDFPIVRLIERALDRQNDRVRVEQHHIADIKVDSIYGVEIVRVSDRFTVHNGCILEERALIPPEEGSDTRRIARLLTETSRSPGSHHPFIALPICHGLCHSQILLEIPGLSAEPPHTLRALLSERRLEFPYSLRSRLRLSIEIARAILVMHSLEIVHKDIRPENILVLGSTTDENNSLQLGYPYLIGFGSTRSAKASTQLGASYYGISEREVSYNRVMHSMIYRHPRHWVKKRTEAYQMRDDIYGLGVCLLEIALWKSLFQWMEGLGAFINNISTLKLYQPTDIPGDLTRRTWRKENQQLLIDLAKKAIPATMGDIYRDVVLECLSCWENPRLRGVAPQDTARDRYAQEMMKETDRSISFYQNVILRLESIRL